MRKGRGSQAVSQHGHRGRRTAGWERLSSSAKQSRKAVHDKLDAGLGLIVSKARAEASAPFVPKQALQTRVYDMATQGAAAQEAKQAAKQSTAHGGVWWCTWRKRWRCRMAAGIAWRVHLGQSRGPPVCLSKLEPERARTKLTRPREEGRASLSVLGMVRHP